LEVDGSCRLGRGSACRARVTGAKKNDDDDDEKDDDRDAAEQACGRTTELGA
jgi:hypothetical protein